MCKQAKHKYRIIAFAVVWVEIASTTAQWQPRQSLAGKLLLQASSTILIVYDSKDAPTNPRGIPYAPFVDAVEDYVTDRSEVENTINSFKEMISYVRMYACARHGWSDNHARKYQFMEVNTQRRAAGLRDKIPDIQKTLETVRFLKTRKVDILF